MTPKILAMFPGQGSQFIGMAKDVLAISPENRLIFEEVEDSTRLPIRKLCAEGPEDQLSLTAHQQPCILAVSVAVWRFFYSETGCTPDFFAGHSLGEYSALVAAEKLPLAVAANVVAQRGKAMQHAVPVGEGAMAAVLRWESERLQDLCQQVSQPKQVVEIANYNSPSQQIISGHSAAVDIVTKKLKDDKVLCKKLKVTAPFHSTLMAPAKESMAPILQKLQLNHNDTVVIPNLSGQIEKQYSSNFLIQQIDQPVQWTKTIETAVAADTHTFIEFGPGKVLCGLISRWLGSGKEIYDTQNLKNSIAQVKCL